MGDKGLNRETVFIKVGGSFITYKDKPFSIDYKALESTSTILSRVYDKVNIVVGHGGGSFAHTVVSIMRDKDKEHALVLCRNATRKLNSILADFFIERGLPILSFQTSLLVYKNSSNYRVVKEGIELIKEALKKKFIPLIYGECIYDYDNVYEVLSTEELFRLLIPLIKPSRLVFLERVTGVYDRDPIIYSDAKLIPLINKDNIDHVMSIIGESYGIDVTGGMYSKIRLLYSLAREYGIKSFIVSGYNIENAVKAILGYRNIVGTIISE